MARRIDHLPLKSIVFRQRGNSLRRQLIGLLCILSLALVIISVVVQNRIVLPAFGKIETQGAFRDINRCVDGLNRDIEVISTLVNDWASWDDTYSYIEDRNSGYREANLLEETYESANVNFLALYNASGEKVWGEIFDLETLGKLDVPDLWEIVTDPKRKLIDHKVVEKGKEGIILTSHGPLMLASRPIITSKREGPIRGSLLMGRFLNQNEILNLAGRSHVSLKVWPLVNAVLPEGEAQILRKVEDWSAPHIAVHDDVSLYAYAKVNGIGGDPALLLRVDVPREIAAQGRISAKFAIFATLIGSLLIVGVAGWIIQRRVVGPLQEVVAHADRLGRDDDLKARLDMKRPDEIGALARSIDAMVASIEESRKIVLDSAHKAGMADVAGEVLHNIGNVVNTANTSIEILESKSAQSHIEGLEKAARLLNEQAPRASDFFATDPRAPKLIEYISQLSEAFRNDHSETSQVVARLSNSIRHIRSIVAMQKDHTKGAEFLQEVSLEGLVKETLLLKQDRIMASNIEVHMQIKGIPPFFTSKSKLSQVLLNLVKNGIEAMEQGTKGARGLLIRAKVVEGGVGIEVRDMGPGFPAENSARLFEHGYTTKEDGTGIGLHYCANAIRSLGGRISVQNCEAPRGTSFQIWLPNANNPPVPESEKKEKDTGAAVPI